MLHHVLANRESEVELLEQIVAGQRTERILLLEAESGMGKTWLLGEFLRRCRERVMCVSVDCAGNGLHDILFAICDVLGWNHFSQFEDSVRNLSSYPGTIMRHMTEDDSIHMPHKAYQIPAIRTLLRKAFTPQDMKRFLRDRPESFTGLLERCPSDADLETMIDHVIEYCDQFCRFPDLLAGVKKYNYAQYKAYYQHIDDARADGETSASSASHRPDADVSLTPLRIQRALYSPDDDDRKARRTDLTSAFLADLRSLSKPVLFLFDTYDKIIPEAQEWLAGSVLSFTPRCPNLVVVVAGQYVPQVSTSFADHVIHHQLPRMSSAKPWQQYADTIGIHLPSSSWVATICRLSRGKPNEIKKAFAALSTELPDRLLATPSDEERSWLVTKALLDILPIELQEAVWAAAVTRWFDTDILCAILDWPRAQCSDLYTDLQSLPFIEPFIARDGYAVHSATRTTLLKRLWSGQRAKYVAFSSRAARYFEQGEGSERQIEHVYHLLISDKTKGVEKLCKLGTEWYESFEYSLVYSLAQAGTEHADANRIRDNRHGWAQYWHGKAEFRYYHYEEAMDAYQTALQWTGGDQHLQASCLKAIGDLHYAQAEYVQARSCYESAKGIFRALGDRESEASCLVALGQVHQCNNYERAQACFEDALSCYESSRDHSAAVRDPTSEARCLQALGDVHSALTEYQEARTCYGRAYSLYTDTGNYPATATCLKALGDVSYKEASFSDAEERYEEALSIYAAMGDRIGRAHCIKALGDIDYVLVRYEQARKRYYEAKGIYGTIGCRQGEANCLQSLGEIHYMVDGYALAHASYLQAFEIYTAIPDRRGEARCLQALAKIHKRQGEYPEAFSLCAKAQAIYEADRDSLALMECIALTGSIYYSMADYLSARSHYEEALDGFSRVGTPLGKANCIIALGDVHLRLGQSFQARTCYLEARSLFATIGERLEQANCELGLGDVEREENNCLEAEQFYRAALQVYQEARVPYNIEKALQRLSAVAQARANKS